MKLLFLTPQLPYPPRQGTALRNWGLISGLAAHHSITLVSFAEAGQQLEEPLRSAVREARAVPAPHRTRLDRLRTILGSGDADMARRLDSDEYRRTLREALAARSFDAVHVEGIEMATYLPEVKSALSGSGGLVVYDAHNAETLLQQRAYATDRRMPARLPGALYSLAQSRRLAHFEAWTLRQADRVLCVSPEDAAALRALVPESRPVLVPNGIDLDEYSEIPNPNFQLPIAEGESAFHETQPLTPNPLNEMAAAEGNIVLFTGKMDYRPNVDAALWFAEAILPAVRQARPGARFVIAGQQPVPRLRALQRRDGIEVTGAVPDLRPYLAAADVYVAPLRMGGGTRFKLLEAMALRRAIVSTGLGAEGFAVTSGRELVLADSPGDFATAVIDLLADREKRATLGESARRFVEGGYDWRAILPRLEAIYRH